MDQLRRVPRDSVDSCVTDPPYGWRFMGKAWDGEDIIEMERAKKRKKVFDKKNSRGRTLTNAAAAAGQYDLSPSANQSFQKFSEEWGREVYRVLKPGAYALIFCGPRTYHRMVCGIEDAGFEIRDCLIWLFGSGFPKSLDVSKAIDKAAGAMGSRGKGFNTAGQNVGLNQNRELRSDHPNYVPPRPITAAAAAWQGWGTALKPAYEPILLARKPISEKTVARNVLKYGTGALNIDATRIGNWKHSVGGGLSQAGDHLPQLPLGQVVDKQGRFPSHVILDEEAARMVDAQSGTLNTNAGTARSIHRAGLFGVETQPGRVVGVKDTGGASRFFYCAKTSKHERHFGATGKGNKHPTVKPFRLMRYLVKLVTPPGGIVLDPFMGSGTTGSVVVAGGWRFIGVEKERESFDTAKARIESVKLKI